jgi:hypothetical protein
MLCAGACGSTLRDIPHVQPQEVQFSGLPALVPPNLSLSVLDERPQGMRKNQAELEQVLRGLLSQVLSSQHLHVAEGAPHTLTLHVRAKDPTRFEDFDTKRCVSLHARLEQSGVYFVESTGIGCHQVRHVVGLTVGGDISEAYRVAMNELLRGLSQELESLAQRQELGELTSEADGFAAGSAKLSVRVRPAAATVSIDGHPQPVGEVNELELPPGEHRIEVTASGMMPDHRTVQLLAGQSLVLTCSLSSESAVQVTPAKKRGRSYLWPAIIAGIVAGATVGTISALQ